MLVSFSLALSFSPLGTTFYESRETVIMKSELKLWMQKEIEREREKKRGRKTHQTVSSKREGKLKNELSEIFHANDSHPPLFLPFWTNSFSISCLTDLMRLGEREREEERTDFFNLSIFRHKKSFRCLTSPGLLLPQKISLLDFQVSFQARANLLSREEGKKGIEETDL